MRLDVVQDDLLSQDVPFDEVMILPDCPTATEEVVVITVAVYSSSSSLQEMMVILKQEIRIMNKTFFIELQYALGK